MVAKKNILREALENALYPLWFIHALNYLKNRDERLED